MSDCQWNHVIKINQKIDKYIQNGGKEETCQIVSAFIIFETEEGYEEALDIINDNSHLKNYEERILGRKIYMK